MIGNEGVSPTGSVAPNQKLLFLTQRIPYPPIKGEKIRSLQILKHLAKSYDIYLGCLVDDPHDWEHVDIIKALCRDSYFGALDRRWDKLYHLVALATGNALSVSLYHHHGLAGWVSRILETVTPDVIFISSSNMAPYVLDHPHRVGKTIVDLVDVDSEKWRAYAGKGGLITRWIYGREAQKIFNLERRIAYEADFSMFVSEAEAKLFRTLVPQRSGAIVSINNGIDHSYFDPNIKFAAPYDSSLPTFVFTGTMDYLPNVDAVRWFAEEIFPMVRKTLPGAQFFIVGASPSVSVQKLGRLAGVHVTGRVPDVRPYLAFATAGVAPMRIARGIQNKVMEAMSMAKPVIVTSDALEGIEAAEGTELVLANDAQTFAAAVCRLAVEPAIAQKIGAAARRRVVEDYSWERQLAGFDSLLLRQPMYTNREARS